MKVQCTYEGECHHDTCFHKNLHDKEGPTCDTHTDFYDCKMHSKCIPIHIERVRLCRDSNWKNRFGGLSGNKPCPYGSDDGLCLMGPLGKCSDQWKPYSYAERMKAIDPEIKYGIYPESDSPNVFIHGNVCRAWMPIDAVLQRVRMCLWDDPEEKDWFCARREENGHGYTTVGLIPPRHTRKEALEWCEKHPDSRAFKWSDGVQG